MNSVVGLLYFSSQHIPFVSHVESHWGGDTGVAQSVGSNKILFIAHGLVHCVQRPFARSFGM